MLLYIIASLLCSYVNISFLYPAIKAFGCTGWKWKYMRFETTNFFFGPIVTIILLYSLNWWTEKYIKSHKGE